MYNKKSYILKTLAIPFISLIVFILMYMLSKSGSEAAYHYFMKGAIGNTGRWLNTYGPEWFVDINKSISALGGPAVFSFITVFTLFVLIITKEFKTCLEFLIAVLGIMILLYGLKYTLNTNRPADIFNLLLNDDLGFPSGHAASSIVLYLSIAIYSGRKAKFRLRAAVASLAVVLIILIGFSRLVVGAHTPEEVIAGWCIGIFWLSLVNLFFSGRNITGEKAHI